MAVKIALTNYYFSNDDENAVYFRNETERAEYFNLTALFANAITIPSISWGNLLNIRVTYKNNNNILETLNKNYAIIYNEDSAQYLFYFIKNINYDSGGSGTSNITQVVLTLEMDVLSTYIIDSNINSTTFDECKIVKGSVTTLEMGNNNSMHFILDREKPYLQNYTQNYNKLIYKSDKLYLTVDNTVNSNLQQWLNDNVLAWCYVFLQPRTYKDANGNDFVFSNLHYNTTNRNRSVEGVGSAICFPIYNPNTSGFIYYHSNGLNDSTNIISLNSIGLAGFRNINNDASYFINLKISVIPPFSVRQYIENTDYSIIDNDLHLNNQNTLAVMLTQAVSGYSGQGVIMYNNQETVTFETNEINIRQFLKCSFSDSERNSYIYGTRDFKFNPFLLTQNFRVLRLRDNAGSVYDYSGIDIATNNSTIKFKYSEALTPDITKGYLRPVVTTDFLDIQSQNNLTGLIINNDLSIPYANNLFESFMSNNKNFYQQTLYNRVANLATGNIFKALSNVVNTNFELDSLTAKPEEISGANGNAIFSSTFNDDFGLFVECLICYDINLQVENDNNFFYGYNINKIDNIRNYLNKHKYFDYIKAELKTINLSVNNDIKNKIIEIFNRGIRFYYLTYFATTDNYLLEPLDIINSGNNPEIGVLDG